MNVEKTLITLANLESQSNQLIDKAEELYAKNFAQFFSSMRTAYNAVIAHGDKAFSDDELESILTELPLDLFSASEALSKFKLHLDVAKLQTKQDMRTANQFSNAEDVEYDKLIQSIYASVIKRVESEISFSREFIMVLKKFWDARRATEHVMPVGEVVPEIPEYKLPNGQTYIK